MDVKDLYNAADVKKVKEILLKEQNGKCAISKQAFPSTDFHTDHKHDDEQFVRAALYKQSNMMLGKIENLYIRYLAFWYKGTLPEFLRQCADYIEDTDRQIPRWRHPGWLAKAKTKFNKLNVLQQNFVLTELESKTGKNLTERKKLFAKAIMRRDLGYNTISEILNKAKEL